MTTPSHEADERPGDPAVEAHDDDEKHDVVGAIPGGDLATTFEPEEDAPGPEPTARA